MHLNDPSLYMTSPANSLERLDNVGMVPNLIQISVLCISLTPACTAQARTPARKAASAAATVPTAGPACNSESLAPRLATSEGELLEKSNFVIPPAFRRRGE